MEWMKLVTQLLDVIVWPVVALVALLLFRSNLGRAIDRIRKVSSGDRSLELSVEEALALPSPRPEADRGSAHDPYLEGRDAEDQQLLSLAKSRPNKAVWNAYVRVLQPLRSVTGEIGGEARELEQGLLDLAVQDKVTTDFASAGAALERVARTVWDGDSVLEPPTAMALVRSANDLHAVLDEIRPGRRRE